MAEMTVYPSVLSGEITLPVSKSAAHRAVICSALARMTEDRIDLGNETSLSDDIRITRIAMRDLLAGRDEIFCGESGSTLRFLVPVAAALGKCVTFTGTGRLPFRPLKEYLYAFENKGTVLRFPDDTSRSLPLKISGKLGFGVFKIPGNVSSQYVSGLLMALPLLDGDSEISLSSDLESSGYVDMTIRIMKDFGVTAVRRKNDFYISGRQKYTDIDYKVEGDHSAAAFWLVANYLGGDIRLEGLSGSSDQGDSKITDILGNYAQMKEGRTECGIRGYSPVVEIDVSDIPDLVPVLCVAAAATDAITIFKGASRLRLKESDRIMSSVRMISSIGGKAEDTADGIRISGSEEIFTGGEVDSFSDHRIAMSAAIAGAFSRNGVSISDPLCVNKSYPGFFNDLISAGGVVDGFDNW